MKRLYILFSIFLFSLMILPTGAMAEFNSNYIISNDDVLNYNSMTLDEIVNFINGKGGYLAKYLTKNPDGQLMSSSEIIYDRATTNKINPKFLIVLLQKEQSLIENTNRNDRALDFATGYGCFDGQSCSERWRGFWKQVNSASLQFKYFMDGCNEEGENKGELCEYKPNSTYTFSNPYSTLRQGNTIVTPANRATAALYNYTPHVYNGNYNFYKIWQRYFTRTYPDGTLLQAEGEPGVWLIQYGKKRPFLTRGALVSRFDPSRIITVAKTELSKYAKGTPIKFPEYSLIRSPRGSMYLLVGNTRRLIDGNAFKQLGYNPEEIIDASWEDINAYRPSKPINASSTYITGALLQDNKTGGVYYVIDGTKAPLYDSIFLKTKYKGLSLVPVDPEKLAGYRTIKPIVFDDGTLLKSPTNPTVYVIALGKKLPITSGRVFEGLGYKWDNIITVNQKIVDLYSTGNPIDNSFLNTTPDNNE